MQPNGSTSQVVILIKLVCLVADSLAYLKAFWVNSSVCITATNAPPKHYLPNDDFGTLELFRVIVTYLLKNLI
jgi:hypothetical protein